MEIKVSERVTPESEDLVARARQGSRDAFGELVDRYQDDVRTFIRWQLGASATSDDLAQEVFVEAFRHLSKFRGEGTFRSWLLGIARHRVLTHLRQKPRHLQTSLDESLAELQIASEGRDPLDAEVRLEQIRALHDCLTALPKERQHLVEQFYFHAIPISVISRTLDRKPGSVRMMLLRIRELLRQCVEKATARES